MGSPNEKKEEGILEENRQKDGLTHLMSWPHFKPSSSNITPLLRKRKKKTNLKEKQLGHLDFTKKSKFCACKVDHFSCT